MNPSAFTRTHASRGVTDEATPRSRIRELKIELPDYVWIELKKRAAEEIVFGLLLARWNGRNPPACASAYRSTSQ